MLVHPQGLVLTARHVVQEDGGHCARAVPVILADGRKARGFVFRAHAILDFALLWLDRTGPFAFVELGDPRALRPAESVLVIGHPECFRNTVTRGSVANPRAVVNGIEFVQTDAAADQGNSGGPVLDFSGQVVGINSWQYGNLDSGKFAVLVDYVRADSSGHVREDAAGGPSRRTPNNCAGSPQELAERLEKLLNPQEPQTPASSSAPVVSPGVDFSAGGQ